MIFRKIVAVTAGFLAMLPSARAQPNAALVPSCVAYTGQTCADYIDYTVLSQTATLNIPPLSNLSASLHSVDPFCVDTYFRYACSFYIPKCDAGGGRDAIKMGCESTCQQVIEACGATFTLTGQTDLLPDCSKPSPVTNVTLQPDNNCNMIPPKVSESAAGINLGAIPSGFVLATCPAPFVRDPLAKQGTTNSVNPTYCRFGCCIPCPAQNIFFPEGWAERGFLAADIVRFVSAVLSFVILLSYLVLPDKRRHPSLLILNLSAAIFLFSTAAFFSISNPKRVQCADDINPSTQDNNALCGVQGALSIFSSIAMVTWCAALIVNLHLHTVWNINFFSNRYYLLNTLCWGIPITIMSVAVGMHKVQFEFANLCVVSLEYIFEMFFYPMAAIICPAFLLHMITFIYIARTAIREGMESEMSQSLSANSQYHNQGARPGLRQRHVVTAVKIQWRALMLAVVAIVTVLFYWIFYFTQMGRMTDLYDNDTAVNAWLQCMMKPGSTQEICAETVKPYLPPFPIMITAETLVSLIGIWLFVIFGKRSLWRDWNDLIYDIRVSLGARNRMEKNGEQFFAL